MVFYIWALSKAFLCITPPLSCTPIPVDALQIMLLAGTVEMTFEIAGVMKLFRHTNKDDDDDKKE